MATPIFLQQLRQFNDPLSDNDLLLVKVKRRVNMPADEDMGVRYSKFIDQLQLGRFVQKAGDTMLGDLVFVNNRGIFGTTTGGSTRAIFKLDNADNVIIGSTSHVTKLNSKDTLKVNINGNEFTSYHSGNSNLGNVDWKARNIVADQTLWVNGESTFGNINIRKLSAIYGYDAGNLKVRMLGIDSDDDVAVGVTTKRFGILVNSPNEVWAVQEEGNPAKQWRMLNTGNFTTHLNGTYVLKTQKVNGKALAGDITLTAADVNALPAIGKTVQSTNGSNVIFEGIAPTLTFKETDTLKEYHLIIDGGHIRINEDSAIGRDVWNWDRALGQFRTSGFVFANTSTSSYSGQNGWQIPFIGKESGAITSSSRPAGADQYAGVGVHATGNIYLWNHLSTAGYALEVTPTDVMVGRNLYEFGKRVYSPNNKPNNTDVGLGNVPNTIHTELPTPNTVPLRDASGDITCRVFRGTYANDNVYTDLGAMAFRVNTTDNVIRFCSDKVVINNWLGALSRDIVNMDYSQSWADIVGKIPKVTSQGVIEVGKYIDLRDTNSNTDYDIRLAVTGSVGSYALQIANSNGYSSIGALNASAFHIYTDRPYVAFNKPLIVDVNGASANTEFRNTPSLVLKYSGRRHLIMTDINGNVDGYLYKDLNQSWTLSHGATAESNLKWTQNGELIVDGARWVATHAHGYDQQYGTIAPVYVNFGGVNGGSDYYPIIRGASFATGHGATTQIDLGFLRASNTWAQAIIRVASDESSAPQANYAFTIDGDFIAPRNGNFNDVYIRSDESLKKNCKDLDNSLTGVLKLLPVEYDKRRVDSDVYDMHEEGLIAQHVEKVFPNAIHTDPSTGLKSLKPYALIARLIGAIQEQQQMIEELRNGNC